MAVIEPDEPNEWVQIDGYGVYTGKAYTGTFAGLRLHLLRELPDGSVGEPRTTRVYVHSMGTTVTCPMVTLTTPWGAHRWICRPAGRRTHWRDWLLRS